MWQLLLLMLPLQLLKVKKQQVAQQRCNTALIPPVVSARYSQAVMAQDQAQVLLRHLWNRLLHGCQGAQHLICDILNLLLCQRWIDAPSKVEGKVL